LEAEPESDSNITGFGISANIVFVLLTESLKSVRPSKQLYPPVVLVQTLSTVKKEWVKWKKEEDIKTVMEKSLNVSDLTLSHNRGLL
jgi:hypothetical protein